MRASYFLILLKSLISLFIFMRLYLLVFALLLSFNSLSQELLSYIEIEHYTQQELEKIWEENKINEWIVPISNGFKLYEVIYTTSWHDGSTIKAS